ncbi:MAG: hypothetical protein UV82_C0005G0006 [Candidatus Magasanikbacteria bacterium GW2011_GWD2_43_18]|uniref:Uncharacterized protein n=1 Tax=Candidatus Magasanikbacteria bacterium GW2011_GWE2_42_7 TaxID=1619052 RepID=A0A0G1BC67_9BACT|nr:MAG: hypothetical protein UV18_C0005G0188 [Candidatus Magasanikbacteria bacterium GW2011_GWC2_42_27]KKS70965.1 MAG: hypothetical protein UV42_C0039G0003 [Candidatus Magasanikbacteria bacterium GW2011_GWE2_42_7]KKT04768.1 MAG: hypothetical protein UV82_C0005G0006 [Candidatus Magasanikbacteria bacterium GW2011_GWD2_43_18]KKT25875.1 MAG: hypothetical protein UW10_C0003G0036 [Candidatus Magasanikbacteria bacterium GW2011_GWA2_43_9]
MFVPFHCTKTSDDAETLAEIHFLSSNLNKNEHPTIPAEIRFNKKHTPFTKCVFYVLREVYLEYISIFTCFTPNPRALFFASAIISREVG